MTSGEIFDLLFVRKQLADQVGITRVLGTAAEGKLNLLLILARIAHGGSRLAAVRGAQQHTVADVLGVDGFDEDDLSAALDWLASQQERIERELYQAYVQRQGQPPVLVLYDVTSSYFEGECNELGQYGYNRDGKRGNTAPGNRYVRTVLGEITWAATRTTSQFRSRFQGVVIRRGTTKAIVAIGHKVVKIVFVLLSRQVPYQDATVDYAALTVKRNAPRWIGALKQFGYLPQLA